MARKGRSLVVRRLAAPAYLRINKKEYAFTAKAIPGPHKAGKSFTLLYVLRDLLKVVTTAKEAKKVVVAGHVIVDGKPRKDIHFPVGLMDVIEIPALKKTFRVNTDKLYYYKLVEIDKDAHFKLCKIIGKTMQPGGNVQLNLHDGRSVLVRVKDPKNPKEAAEYTIGSTVKIDLRSGEIVDSVKLEEGKLAIVVDGINDGRMGKITKITKIMKNDTATLEDKGESFETKLKYLFVLGDSKPLVSLG
ncbi:MAG: 30S ribosomal protein S4e [Candidatus Sigynarchaeota archaeon]